jgi:hypothetical protein
LKGNVQGSFDENSTKVTRAPLEPYFLEHRRLIPARAIFADPPKRSASYRPARTSWPKGTALSNIDFVDQYWPVLWQHAPEVVSSIPPKSRTKSYIDFLIFRADHLHGFQPPGVTSDDYVLFDRVDPQPKRIHQLQCRFEQLSISNYNEFRPTGPIF